MAEKQTIPHFRSFLDECMHERVGQLYSKLEETKEFQKISPKEDELESKLSNAIPPELETSFKAYTDAVEQKYIQYRHFYYREGFWDSVAINRKRDDFLAITDSRVREKVKQHERKLEKRESFINLTAQENRLYSELKASIPDELALTLQAFGKLVQQKYAQYQKFYYREGYMEYAQFNESPPDDMGD